MVGGIFLAYQNRPPKWRIFKYMKWKKGIKKYNNRVKGGVLKYR